MSKIVQNINFIATGGMIILALLHLSLFIIRRETFNVFFTIMMAAGIFYMIVNSDDKSLTTLKSFSNIFCGAIALLLIPHTIYTLLEIEVPHRMTFIYYIGLIEVIKLIIFIAVIVFLKYEFYKKYFFTPFFIISNINMVVFFSTTLFLFFSQDKIKNPISFFLLGALALILLGAMTERLYDNFNLLKPLKGNHILLLLAIFLLTISVFIKYYKQYDDKERSLNTALDFKSNLLTTTAHHTKTPLTLIQNGFDSLFTMYPDLKNNRQLNMIKRNVELMRRDIVNIFDTAQLEQGKRIAGERKVFNLSKMLEDKVELFGDTARLKGIHIKPGIEVDIFVESDDLALNRVIDNLLDNAVKYCQSGAIIKVKLKGDGSKVSLTVEDDGPGIAKEELSHIFERYYQIEREKQVSSGLGLGLALTKEIVEELGGTIRPDSVVDRGTIFKIELARAVSKDSEKYELTGPVESSPVVVEEVKSHKRGKTILIVEDEPELLLYLRDVLGEEYNITPAVNGREALDKLESCRPDLIISDVMMAEVDGFSLKERLPEEYRHTPFIFITAKTKESDKLEGLALGADSYIYKPFNIEEVKLKVNRLLSVVVEQNKSTIDLIIEAAQREKERLEGRSLTFEERCEEYSLSVREVEVVLALRDSKTNEEAAGKLTITFETIKSHIKNIYKKVGVNNKKDLFLKLF